MLNKLNQQMQKYIRGNGLERQQTTTNAKIVP